MTDNPFAALLDGVRRYSYHDYDEDDGFCLREKDVLAALAAAVPADLAEAGKVLEGVTPGPWRADGEPWNQIVWSGADNRVCFMAHSNGLDDARDVATARFIAWCREGVPALIATVTAQAAGIEALMNGAGAASQVALDYIARAEAAEAALAAMTKERDELRAENERLAKDYDVAKAFHDLAVGERNRARDLNATLETALAAERAKTARLVEAADWQEKQRRDAFARRHLNAPEDVHVAVLCERYGYGAVMDAASRLWARKDSIGAFYIGGCIRISPNAAITEAGQ